MVYVGQDEILSALDAKTGAIEAAIKLPGSVHGFKIDEVAGKIYCVLTKPSAIAVVDVAKNEVTDKFALTLSQPPRPIPKDPPTAFASLAPPRSQPRAGWREPKHATGLLPR